MPGLPLAAFLFATAFCAAGAAECGATEYRLEDVPVLSCSGGLGTAHLEFAASSDVRALRFLPGVVDLSVNWTGGAGVRLLDGDKCIFGPGCLHEDDAQLSYEGTLLSLEESSSRGRSIGISGVLNWTMVLAINATTPGPVDVDFSWSSVYPCPDYLHGCAPCESHQGCAELEVPRCNGTAEVACIALNTMTTTSMTTTTRTTTLVYCASDQYQAAEFVLRCDAESARGEIRLEKGELAEMLRLPSGLQNVSISLSTQDTDADMYLHDAVTGECLVGYNCRFTEAAVCADGLDAPCLDNEHGLLSFGGFSDKAPVNEIMVIWEVRRDLVLYGMLLRPGLVNVSFSHAPLQTCDEVGMVNPGCEPCHRYAGCRADEAPVCSGGLRVDCMEPTTRTTTSPPTTTLNMTDMVNVSKTSTTTTTTTTTPTWECVEDLANITNAVVLHFMDLEYNHTYPMFFRSQILAGLANFGVSEVAQSTLEIRMCFGYPAGVTAQIFGSEYAMWEVWPIPLDFLEVNNTLPVIVIGPPTTTTTTTRFQGIPCSFSAWTSSDRKPSDFSGSNCPFTMKENQTCSITCRKGQAMGELRCLMGYIVGTPLCAEEGVEVEAVTKIAGAFELDAQLPAGSSVGSPRLPETLVAMLSGVVDVDVADFTVFKVTTPGVKVQYELVVHDPLRLNDLKRDLAALDLHGGSQTHSGVGATFARTLLYYGIRVRRIAVTHPPTAFQEMAIALGPSSEAAGMPDGNRLATGMITGGFVGFMCGLPILACVIHSVRHGKNKRNSKHTGKRAVLPQYGARSRAQE